MRLLSNSVRCVYSIVLTSYSKYISCRIPSGFKHAQDKVNKLELVTLDKLDVMKLDFTVPEVFLDRLSAGLSLSATTAAYPDEVFRGEISSIGTRIDPVSRSVNVRAELANPDLKLRPGMLMEVIVQQRVRDGADACGRASGRWSPRS